MILQRRFSHWGVFCLLTFFVVEIAAQRKFRYAVTEPASSSYSHERSWQDDGTTQGSYRTLMPDGRWQVVNYHADDDGFKAHIRYEPTTTVPLLAEEEAADNVNNRPQARWKLPEESQTPSVIPAPPIYRPRQRDSDTGTHFQHGSPQGYYLSTEPQLDDYVLPGPAFSQSELSLEKQRDSAPAYPPQHRAPFEPVFPFFNPEKQKTEFHKQSNYVVPRPDDFGPTSDSPRPAAYNGAAALLYSLHSIAGQNSASDATYNTPKKRPKLRPQSEDFYPINEEFNTAHRPTQYTTPISPVDLPLLQYPFHDTAVSERPISIDTLPAKRDELFLDIPGLKGPFPSPQPPLPFPDDEKHISHTIFAAPVPERNGRHKSHPSPNAPKENYVDKQETFVPPPFPKKPTHRAKSPRPYSGSSTTDADHADRPIVFNPPPFPKKGATRTRPNARPFGNNEEEDPRSPHGREKSDFGRLHNTQNSFTEPQEQYFGTHNLQYTNGDTSDDQRISFNPPAFRPKNIPSPATLQYKDSAQSKPPIKRLQHDGFGQRLRPLKRPSMHFGNDEDFSGFHNQPVTLPKPSKKQNLFFQEALFSTPDEPIDLFFPPQSFAPIIVIPPQTIIHPIAKDQTSAFIPRQATPSSVQVPIFEHPEESSHPTTEAPPPLPPATLRPRIRIHGHPSAETLTQALPRARAIDAPVRKSPVSKSNVKTVSVPTQNTKTIARSATTKAPLRRAQDSRLERSKIGVSVVTSKPNVVKIMKPKLNQTTTTPAKVKGPQAPPLVRSATEEFLAEAAQASAYTATSTSVKPEKNTPSFVTVWAVALPLTHSENVTEIAPDTINAL